MTIDDTNGHLRGWSDEIGDRCGPVTPAEAFEILARFCHSHFDGRKGDVGREKARISIPADPRRDDDLRMHAFIAQSAELRAEVERLTRERDEARAHTSTAAFMRLEADRDRLAAALAEVREAARACVDAFDDIGVPRAECSARNEALRVVLAATPADLAAAHDARVRAEALPQRPESPASPQTERGER